MTRSPRTKSGGVRAAIHPGRTALRLGPVAGAVSPWTMMILAATVAWAGGCGRAPSSAAAPAAATPRSLTEVETQALWRAWNDFWSDISSVPADVSCPGGGRATVGAVDSGAGAGGAQAMATITWTADGCALEDGFVVTIDPLEVVLQISLDLSVGTVELLVNMTGTFQWTLGRRSGSCPVDLATRYSGSMDDFGGAGIDLQLQGKLCGHEGNYDFSVVGDDFQESDV